MTIRATMLCADSALIGSQESADETPYGRKGEVIRTGNADHDMRLVCLIMAKSSTPTTQFRSVHIPYNQLHTMSVPDSHSTTLSAFLRCLVVNRFRILASERPIHVFRHRLPEKGYRQHGGSSQPSIDLPSQSAVHWQHRW